MREKYRKLWYIMICLEFVKGIEIVKNKFIKDIGGAKMTFYQILQMDPGTIKRLIKLNDNQQVKSD